LYSGGAVDAMSVHQKTSWRWAGSLPRTRIPLSATEARRDAEAGSWTPTFDQCARAPARVVVEWAQREEGQWKIATPSQQVVAPTHA